MIGSICPNKLCNKCKEIKPLIDFIKDLHKKTGRGSKCKECSRLVSKEYGEKHRKERTEYNKRWADENKEYTKEKEKKDPCFKPKSQTRKEITYEEVREKKREEYRRFSEKNPRKIKEYQKSAAPKRLKQVKEREQKDLDFKFRRRLRHRINLALKGQSRETSSLQLLGCSMSFFRNWIEKNFEQGMNWENYGYGKNKWNLDHNIPCSSFDLNSTEQQKICFHWSNIFPMWQRFNFSKNDNIWIIDYEI